MNEDINSILLESILHQLTLRNLKEKDCINAIGASSSFFSDWKAGRLKNPSFNKIYRISFFLNVSIDFLLTGNDNIQTANKDDNIQEKLAADERSLINTYREMNDDGKTKMLDESRRIWADYPLPLEDNQLNSKSTYYPMNEKNVGNAG